MPQWRRTIGKLDFEDFEVMLDEDLANRCGGDAEAALRLGKRIIPEIYANGLGRIYDLAMDVLPILAETGGRGMALNAPELKRRVDALGPWLQQEKAALEAFLGIENLNSDAQLAKALFDPNGRIRATPLDKTTRGYSVGKRSLMWAQHVANQASQSELSALIGRILEYSKNEKVFSTYYLPWYERGGQRVWSNYSLSRAGTGRTSSYDTNLQNVPPVARDLIVPSKGYDWIVACDFKQLEWRIAAFLSRDLQMMRGIRERLDAHAITAARALGLDLEQTSEGFARFKAEHKDERATGKMTNFAVLYGVSDESLSWQVFEQTDGKIYIPVKSSKDVSGTEDYIKAFFDEYRGYQSYGDGLRAKVFSGEWITSPTGRRWILPRSNAGWRQALNYPIQSLASDLVLMAIRMIYGYLHGRMSRIIGEVHDSVIFETTERELPQLIKMVKHVCENIDTSAFGFVLDVPLEIEVQVGKSLGTLKEAA